MEWHAWQRFRVQRWLLNLLSIIGAAYVIGTTGNGLLAAALFERSEMLPLDQIDLTESRNLDPMGEASFWAMAERNLLAAQREGCVAGPPGPMAPRVDGCGFTMERLRPCSLPYQVKGTLVAEGNPRWSLAVLHDTVANETYVFGLTDGMNHVPPDGQLCAVLEGAVVIRQGNAFEQCTADPEPKVSRDSGAGVMQGGESTDGANGIERVRPNTYRVSREQIDWIQANLGTVATQVRLVPQRHGPTRGMRALAIKPGSIFARMGLRNGDVIESVNGYPLDNPEVMLDLYRQLPEAAAVSISLRRNGRRRVLDYSIVQ